MINYITNKKPLYFLLIMLFTIPVMLQSCKKSQSEMGKQLAKATGNKIFKDVTPEDFAPVLKEMITEKKSSLTHPDLLASVYEKNGYKPVLLMKFIKDKKMQLLVDYYKKAPEHGLKPEIFQANTLAELVDKFYDKKGITTLEEVYHEMARVELITANSLMQYSTALQYGLINPRRIYQRYYTQTERPDITFLSRIYHIDKLQNYLDSIQPKNEQYLALQKALSQSIQAKGMTPEETERYFAVTLERLRWKNKPTADKYVLVNIPDYSLNVMENGKSAISMRVCVGEGRNIDEKMSLVEYDESYKVDRPFSRETPQLNSDIYAVQVNPVWNIPKSIASKEIMVLAAKDPYYLANKNIKVFYKGSEVENPETVNWSDASANDYRFQQQPGDGNALGKIKFLFKNSSAVYLHDTPSQYAFKEDMRAVSHGCVRVQKPEDLALALFGRTDKYETISNAMHTDSPDPTDLSLPKKIPVYITYITCWLDDNGGLQFRPDVYGLDAVLYAHMQRFASV